MLSILEMPGIFPLRRMNRVSHQKLRCWRDSESHRFPDILIIPQMESPGAREPGDFAFCLQEAVFLTFAGNTFRL